MAVRDSSIQYDTHSVAMGTMEADQMVEQTGQKYSNVFPVTNENSWIWDQYQYQSNDALVSHRQHRQEQVGQTRCQYIAQQPSECR